ncbi:MAG: hypothetical protein AAFV46_00820 [Cyanobacteria bacterium J06635_11]
MQHHTARTLQPYSVIAQATDGAGITIPLEAVLLGGFGILLAAGKWLLGREISRLDQSRKDTDRRLDSLERQSASQAVEAATITRMESKVGQLDTDVQALKQALAILPKIESKIELLDEIRAAQATLGQRFENLAYALNQTQELFHGHQRDLADFQGKVARNYVHKQDAATFLRAVGHDGDHDG